MNTSGHNESDIFNISGNASDFVWDFCKYTRPGLKWDSICILLFGTLALVFNACLLFVILRRHYLRNLTNILIVNLTISDMILLISAVPFYIEMSIHPCWQFGAAACKLANTIWVVSHSACMFTLAALAVERYCAVTSRAGFRSKTCALLSIWILASFLGLPTLITSHMPYEGICIGHLADYGYLRGYVTCHVIFTFVMPLCIIVFFYFRMAHVLLIKNNPKPSQQMEEKTKNTGFRKRRRLAATVLALVLLFAICWTPFHLYNLSTAYGLYFASWRANWMFYMLHYVFIFAYLFLNPVVVFYMSPNLRRELLCCTRYDSKRGKLQMLEEDESDSGVSEVDLELQLPIEMKQSIMKSGEQLENTV